MRYGFHIVLFCLGILCMGPAAIAGGAARFHEPAVSVPGVGPALLLPELPEPSGELLSTKFAPPGSAKPASSAVRSTTAKSTTTLPHPRRSLRKLSKEKQARPHRRSGGKSQGLALCLAIFLGILGIHRFYLGYTGIALIQMLTLGGLLIWFIVDAFRIGFGKLKPVRGPYTYRLGKTEGEE